MMKYLNDVYIYKIERNQDGTLSLIQSSAHEFQVVFPLFK